MDLLKSKTLKNLAEAFAGECQANTRYKFIEYGARMQGYNALAEIIDKIAYNEFNHARMFYTFIQKASNKQISNINISTGYPFKEKWDLEQNLMLAAEDERIEALKVYPEHRKIAMEEGFTDIVKLYDEIIKVEKLHRSIFQDLYNQFKTKTLYKKGKEVTWKCSSCGYEFKGKEAWEKCPLCEAEQGFVKILLKHSI